MGSSMYSDATRAAFEKQKRTLFESILESPEPQRAALLAKVALRDPSLADAVRKLLTASGDESDGVLNRPVHERKQPCVEQTPTAIGRYKVLAHIGTGGMGSVYRCTAPDTNDEVAVKIIRSDLAGRSARQHFERERDTLKLLRHPNVCRLLDAGITAGGTAFIVMELVQGRRFDVHCSNRDCSLSQRLLLFSQVLAGVEYFHSHQVIHRDLKPSNLFVAPDGKVKILDFGLAKMIEHSKGQTGHGPTRTIFPFMTIRYASPEQLSGRLSGRASDIYSLGVICYELLTGRHLFSNESSKTPQLLLQTLSTQTPLKPSGLVPGLPPALDDLVMNALHVDPQRRHTSASDFLRELCKCLDCASPPQRSSPGAAKGARP